MKKTRTQVHTRAELEELGESYRWSGDQMALMPIELWDLIRANPNHLPEHPAAGEAYIGDRRVATVVLTSFPVRFRGQDYPCLWPNNFYIDVSREPGEADVMGMRMAAGLMMRKVLKTVRSLGLGLVSYGGTPMANEVDAALRMTQLGLVPRYVLPLRTGPPLRRFLKTGLLTRILAPLGNLTLRAALGALHTLRGAPRAGRALDAIPAGLEQIRDDDIMPDAAANLKRDGSNLGLFLRYASQITTAERIESFRLFDHDGRLRAYFLGRVAVHDKLGSAGFRDVRLYRLLDVAVAPDGDERTAAGVLYHILRRARSLQCQVVEIISNDSRLHAACRRLGFREFNGYELNIGALPEGMPEPALEEWCLTALEAEASYY